MGTDNQNSPRSIYLMGADASATDIILDSYNTLTIQAVGSHTGTAAMFTETRISSIDFRAFRNSIQIGSTATTTAGTLPNCQRFAIGGWMKQDNIIGGGSGSGYSDKQFAFATIGSGLTGLEVLILYTIVQNYQAQLGRQVN
jgi:hypothetical protein